MPLCVKIKLSIFVAQSCEMETVVLISFILLNFFPGFNQHIELNGQYNGENLYVLNSSNNDGAICVTGILVNNKKADDEYNSSSFEIDLSQHGLEVGTPVSIKISHKTGCIPKIINPEAIKIKNNFIFKMIDVDRRGTLHWLIEGDPGDDPFVIEQYRWNKWVKVGEVEVQDTVTHNSYSFEIIPHQGENLFRVVQRDDHGNTICSQEEKYRTIVKEIFLLSDKVKDELEFTSETLYEVYTYEGELVMSGFDSAVDVSSLADGEYWVNYDNKTEIFVKK